MTTTSTLRSVVAHLQYQGDADAFLEPHQPRDYYQTAATAYQQPPTTTRTQHVTFQDAAAPSPTTSTEQSHPQLNQQSYKQPRLSQMAKKPSTNNINPSQQQQRRPLTVNPGLTQVVVNNGSPYYQNPQFLSPVESPQTPPPAYFLKTIELPEIDSVGDLVSEFECDLGSIRY